jgi:hypothetical protein
VFTRNKKAVFLPLPIYELSIFFAAIPRPAGLFGENINGKQRHPTSRLDLNLIAPRSNNPHKDPQHKGLSKPILDIRTPLPTRIIVYTLAVMVVIKPELPYVFGSRVR